MPKKIKLIVTYIKAISPGLVFIFLGLWLTYTRKYYPNWCNFQVDMGPYHDLFGIFAIIIGIFSIIHTIQRLKNINNNDH